MENLEGEVWKPIKGFEGLYEISNTGKVKSLKRKVPHPKYGEQLIHEKILKIGIGINGYFHNTLTKNGIGYIFKVHHLVWDAFGNGKRNGYKIQVDHIDGVKSNNNISNLQLLSARENTSKYYSSTKKSSKYIGVTWCKRWKTWEAQIVMDGKNKYLGYFKDELDASNAYQKMLAIVIQQL